MTFLSQVLKYSADQPREPKGSPYGGQWAKTPGTYFDPTGTMHTDNVQDAMTSISQNQKVFWTDRSKLHELVAAMDTEHKRIEKEGGTPPVWDLAKIQMHGSWLFGGRNYTSLDRGMMPQLAGIPIPGTPADALPKNQFGGVDGTSHFAAYMEAKGWRVERTTARVVDLHATQAELNGAKVGGIMKAGLFRDAPLLVSRENQILDGHHRWAAEIAHDSKNGKLGDIRIPIFRVHASPVVLMMEANQWAKEFGFPSVGITKSILLQQVQKYSEDQPRDEKGRWTKVGGFTDIRDFTTGQKESDYTQDHLAKRLEAETGVRWYIEKDRWSNIFDSTGSVPNNNDLVVARAAVEAADILKLAKAHGLPMPGRVHISDYKYEAEKLTGEVTGNSTTGTTLALKVPGRLPEDISLDEAIQAAFSKRPNFSTVRSFHDFVMHELGHVLHGDAGDKALFESAGEVAKSVSQYAGSNAAEFVAEVFASHHAGNKIPADVLKAYDDWGGYPLGKPLRSAPQGEMFA